MFRAAFWSGLPIVERHEHTFRIGWYEELGEPPGLDATIFTGVTDMKFVNDTGGWLLTEAWADVNRQRLYITLYGSPPAREVYMNYAVLSRTPAPSRPLYVDDPSRPRGTVKQTDWAQPGMTVEVYRTVLQDGQPWIQDSFLSVFEPWPNIFVRGTG
jgi:vancomycin resistance protein YoaR